MHAIARGLCFDFVISSMRQGHSLQFTNTGDITLCPGVAPVRRGRLEIHG